MHTIKHTHASARAHTAAHTMTHSDTHSVTHKCSPSTPRSGFYRYALRTARRPTVHVYCVHAGMCCVRACVRACVLVCVRVCVCVCVHAYAYTGSLILQAYACACGCSCSCACACAFSCACLCLCLCLPPKCETSCPSLSTSKISQHHLEKRVGTEWNCNPSKHFPVGQKCGQTRANSLLVRANRSSTLLQLELVYFCHYFFCFY